MTYWVLGCDGREYGPVSTDTLRVWLGERRVDAQSQVRRDGEADWRRLGERPELALLLPAAPPAPSPAGSAASPSAEAWATPPAAPGTLDVLRCYSRAWETLTGNFWPIVGCTTLGAILPQAVLMTLTLPFSHGRQPAFHSLREMVLNWQILLNLAVSFLVATPFYAGIMLYCLRCVRGERADVTDIFRGFTARYVPVVLMGVMVAVACMLGLFLCLVPGIYLGVGFSMGNFLVMDRGAGAFDALGTSLKVVHRNWFPMFALMLLSLPITLAGMCALCVGVFVAMPLVVLAYAHAYEELFGRPAPGPGGPAMVTRIP